MNRGLLEGIKASPFIPRWMGGGDPANDGAALLADSTQEGGAKWAPGGSGLTAAQVSAGRGFLSLRNDFSLDPTSSIGPLTTAIQSAINTAISAGKGIDCGADLWPINAALTVSGNISFRAAGAWEVFDTATNSQLTVHPGAAPWVVGGGFIQMAAATNILNITGTGVCVHLSDLLLQFGGSSAFNNTGHAVYGVPTATGGAPAKPDNGPVGCRWDNVVVFGTDGNHYAFYTVNMNLFTATQIRGYGGGGWYEECNSSQSVYGNGTLIEPYFCLFVQGTADGFHTKSSGTSFPGRLNLVTMVRPQCLIQNVIGTALGTAFGITTTPVSGTQHPYFDENNVIYVHLIDLDMEPVGFPCVFANGTVITGIEYTSRISKHNTTYGPGALPGTPSGTSNAAFGDSALAALTSGVANTAVGYQALLSNVSGGSNTAVGTGALQLNTAASNTAVGTNALQANTTGSQNAAVGTGALLANTTGTLNMAVGDSALAANTTGGQNMALGSSALAANTTGIRNTAIGVSALATTTTVSNLTAIGFQALTANTTGTANTAVGSPSLPVNTTGSNNTAIGTSSLPVNTTGSQNTAVGQGTLLSNISGSNNTAIGFQCLQSTTGGNNTAVGSNALLANTTGSSGTAVGNGALTANTTGANNVGVGNGGLAANTTGTQNTGVGYQGGAAFTTGNFNTAIGVQAGGTDGTTATLGTISGATCLGWQAEAQVSNVIVLGSAITANRPNLTFGQAGVSAAFGGGVGVFAIANAVTVPASSPTGGGVLYVTAGALTYKGSSGTVTTLGPA